MHRYTWIAILLAAGCSKKSDSPASSKPAEPAKPGAAAPAAGAMKWVQVGTLPVEVEAPACADASPMDKTSATVIAGGGAPGCPGFALQFNDWEGKAPSFDDEIKTLTNGIQLDFTRKDKTADGWILEYKQTDPGDSAPKLKVIAQFQQIQCLGDSWHEDDAAAQRHTCESMRAKK